MVHQKSSNLDGRNERLLQDTHWKDSSRGLRGPLFARLTPQSTPVSPCALCHSLWFTASQANGSEGRLLRMNDVERTGAKRETGPGSWLFALSLRGSGAQRLQNAEASPESSSLTHYPLFFFFELSKLNVLWLQYLSDTSAKYRWKMIGNSH